MEYFIHPNLPQQFKMMDMPLPKYSLDARIFAAIIQGEHTGSKPRKSDFCFCSWTTQRLSLYLLVGRSNCLNRYTSI